MKRQPLSPLSKGTSPPASPQSPWPSRTSNKVSTDNHRCGSLDESSAFKHETEVVQIEEPVDNNNNKESMERILFDEKTPKAGGAISKRLIEDRIYIHKSSQPNIHDCSKTGNSGDEMKDENTHNKTVTAINPKGSWDLSRSFSFGNNKKQEQHNQHNHHRNQRSQSSFSGIWDRLGLSKIENAVDKSASTQEESSCNTQGGQGIDVDDASLREMGENDLFALEVGLLL